MFIRAPVVDAVDPGVEVLARLSPQDPAHPEASVVAVRQGSLLATAFHPELTEDPRFHRYFLEMVQAHKERRSSPK